MHPGDSMRSLNTSQILDVDNALSDFYYASFYRTMLAMSFFMGVFLSITLVGIAWSWTHIQDPKRRRRATIVLSATGLLVVALLCIWVTDLQAQFALISNGGLFLPPGQISDPGINSISLVRYLTYREVSINIPVHTMQTTLLGVSTTLTFLMVYVVHLQRQSGLGLVGVTIPTLCVAMYLSAMGYWIVGTVFTARQISYAASDGNFLSASPSSPMSLRVDVTLSSTFFSLNVILSDVVVFWRMWVVWSKRRILLVVSAVFVLATTVLCIGNIFVEQAIFTSPDWVRALSTSRDSLELSFGANAFGLAALFTSLSSNVLATALIGIKTWQHRRLVMSNIVGHKRRTVAERVLVLLVESGALYIGIWVFYSTTILVPKLSAPDGYQLAFSSHWTPPAEGFIQSSVPQLTVIYPMIILILVALDKTRSDHHFAYNAPTPRDPSLQAVVVSFDVAVERSEHDISYPSETDVSMFGGTREVSKHPLTKVAPSVVDPAIV
ncbi:unnamed protein product [Peniophora sp. CBMAI 1063]|nr:unnamed protein product [Peniophora sp. CBMAI 1063]